MDVAPTEIIYLFCLFVCLFIYLFIFIFCFFADFANRPVVKGMLFCLFFV